MAGNLDGMAELTRRMNELGAGVSAKVLRNAARASLLPVEKQMKMSVPVGSEPHRTYKGNLVSPGFLRRSIRRKAGVKNGAAFAVIGVKAEAFYGINFVDQGTAKMSARAWFKQSFVNGEAEIIDRLKEQIEKGIQKALRR